MSQYCIEYFYAKPEYLEALTSSLLELVRKTLLEPQCEQYDLLQDKANPNLLILVVKFQTEQAMLAHESQSYIKAFMENEMNRLCEKVVWNDAKQVVSRN